MKQETIEQAAKSNALDDISLVGLNERAIAMKHFAQGARWRISSVWHKETEQPDKNQLVLFECRKTYGKGYSVNFGENYPLLKNVILSWAYVKDLLPDGKEDEQ